MESFYKENVAVGVNDGVLVSEPKYTADPTVLERDFTRDTLSQQAHIIGRLMAKMEFTTELRGNGKQNSGILSDAPIITRLLRAAGYKVTAATDATTHGPFDIDVHYNQVTWEVSSGAAASGTFSLPINATAGETVTIGAQTYTFRVTPAAPNDVKIGANADATLVNLAAAINGSAGSGSLYGTFTVANKDVTAVASTGSVVVTAKYHGTSGNAIATTETVTGSGDAWGGLTLTGGTALATSSDVIPYYIEVTTAGASGTAMLRVTSEAGMGEDLAAAVVTSGSAFTIGTKGLTIKPTFTGSLALGQRWTMWLFPAGLKLLPVSDDFESITLVMHKDKVQHTMPGSFGTFEVEAKAGEFAKIKWTFWGTYVDPIDSSLPSPIYEKALPSQVQLARLRMDKFNAIVDKFTFNQGNDIQIRPDVSSEQGYIGTRIVSRKPEGGVDPEADLVSNYDFWAKLATASRMPFQMRVGTVPGNTVWMIAPATQYTKMTYTDRNQILTYDAGLKFSGYQADDEMAFFLC